jgi:hypothetical protein
MTITDEQRVANDKRVADDVHKFGCHVISVFDPEEKHPSFSYSIGIFETSGVPEAIVVGLKPSLGGFIVNEYNRRVRAGTRFQRGQLYDGFLGGFSVYIEPAKPEALTEYTRGCDRYYKGAPYPTVQIVWPSTSGIWPWQAAASEWLKSNQPMLGRERMSWPFSDPQNLGVFCCSSVFERGKPILRVAHDYDGDWQFLDGAAREENELPKLVCFEHVVEWEPAILSLYDLPRGWCAERDSASEEWQRKELPPDEE